MRVFYDAVSFNIQDAITIVSLSMFNSILLMNMTRFNEYLRTLEMQHRESLRWHCQSLRHHDSTQARMLLIIFKIFNSLPNKRTGNALGIH